MRLCIADPPYPPFIGSGGRKNRASRWYGDGQRSHTDRPADFHPEAADWDEPARHRQLLENLMRDFDGWAIATSPDGLDSYRPLPAAARVMAWIKPNAQPGAHRLRSLWEPVIVYPPEGRRSNRGGVGAMPDVLTANAPRVGFTGAKPAEWTHWVLAALGYDSTTDELVDMFSGSGLVGAAVSTSHSLETTVTLASDLLQLHHERISEVDMPQLGIAFGNSACQECAAPWPCPTVRLIESHQKLRS